METLKRDWEAKLTLRDVLVTITCLLVQPNASSALNAEAGKLLEGGEGAWDGFERRAKLMTRLHAGVPRELKEVVREAVGRGEDKEKEELESKESEYVSAGEGGVGKRKDLGKSARAVTPPALRTPTLEEDTDIRMSSPSPRKDHVHQPRPFITQTPQDDIFGIRIPAPHTEPDSDLETDPDLQIHTDQENDITLSPMASKPPNLTTGPSPLRTGPPVPLGELHISDSRPCDNDDSFSSLESEYPPSPKKSPVKQRRNLLPSEDLENSFDVDSSFENSFTAPRPDYGRAESSRNAALRRQLFTPVTRDEGGETATPLAGAGIFSAPKTNKLFGGSKPILGTPAQARKRLATPETDPFNEPRAGNRVGKPALAPKMLGLRGKSVEQRRREELERKLWRLCGGNVERWNRGDFGGHFALKAARW